MKRRRTAEHNRAIGESMKGNTSAKGIPKSAETRRRMSEAHKKKRLSDEHKESIRKAKLGKSRTESTKKNISAGIKKYHERRKKEKEQNKEE